MLANNADNNVDTRAGSRPFHARFIAAPPRSVKGNLGACARAPMTRTSGAWAAEQGNAMKPIRAVSTVLVSGPRLLLVRRGHAPARGMYAFPGGRIENGETPEQAARRELFEETGLCAGKLTLLRMADVPPAEDMPAYRLHVFIGEHPGGAPRAGDDAEHAGWYDLAQIETLPVTKACLEIARSLLQ